MLNGVDRSVWGTNLTPMLRQEICLRKNGYKAGLLQQGFHFAANRFRNGIGAGKR